jgi:hypothetical protein
VDVVGGPRVVYECAGGEPGGGRDDPEEGHHHVSSFTLHTCHRDVIASYRGRGGGGG